MSDNSDFDYNKKYIGTVKWFGDKARDAAYGFIHNSQVGDIFVHKSGLSENVFSLEKDEYVVFSLQINSKSPDKVYAVDVHYIYQEMDINLLTQEFFITLVDSTSTILRLKLSEQIKELISKGYEINPQTKEYIITKFQIVVNENLNDNTLNFIYEKKDYFNFLKDVFKNEGQYIFDHILIENAIEFKISLWTYEYIEFESINYIIDHFNELSTDLQNRVIDKCNDEDKYKIIQHLITTFSSQDSSNIELFIKRILKITDTLSDSLLEKTTVLINQNFNIEVRFNLWQNGILDTFDNNYIDYILLNFSSFDEDIISDIISKCPEKFQLKLMIQLFEKFINLSYSKSDIEEFINFVDYFEDFINQDIVKHFLSIKNTTISLILWLKGYSENFDYYEYCKQIYFLPNTMQIRFIRLVFKLLHEKKINITANQLFEINRLYSSNIDNPDYKLDKSVSLALSLIKKISEGETDITNKELFEIIINSIKSPFDKIKITEFFNECRGQAYTYSHLISNENDSLLDEDEVKRSDILFRFCEGRKAIKNGAPQRDNNFKKEFWWCANQVCLRSSRYLNDSSDWEEYTIADFLYILNIPFSDDQYGYLTGLINKINVFLEHLYCRECGHILHPQNQSNYAFYRVNTFNCINENCTVSKDKEEIYITHCINGKCSNVVDSRDSAKCSNGWYICDNCYACCSTEKINYRTQFQQNDYNINQGHFDLGKICCPKCGEEMLIKSIDYSKAFSWFVKNKDNKTVVHNYGVRKNGKCWFLFKKPYNMTKIQYLNKLYNLKNIGFSIPDIDDETKTLQLIGEGDVTPIIKCINCDNELDLQQIFDDRDITRLKALRYHVALNPLIDSVFENKKNRF